MITIWKNGGVQIFARNSFLGERRWSLFVLVLLMPGVVKGQAPSSLFSDIENFKVEFPLDKNGEDYEGVTYNDRNNPHIKNATEDDLEGFIAKPPFDHYFFVSDKEMVFRAHCAGALTSINAYPRCELREQINGKNTFWSYQDQQELNTTLRITKLPAEKREVCVVQLKGTNHPSKTSGTSEVLRVEYRQDGNSGWHLEVNESSGPRDVLDYSVGQSVKIQVRVDKGIVRLNMKNLTNGDTYSLDYKSEFSHGYFKAGAYTQSSIWSEKSGSNAEDASAYSEVRFSEFILGESNNSSSSRSASTTDSNKK